MTTVQWTVANDNGLRNGACPKCEVISFIEPNEQPCANRTSSFVYWYFLEDLKFLK
jgi:hypothetical protein